MIKVYQANRLSFDPTNEVTEFTKTDFTHVATVNTKSLDDAYFRTQSLSNAWYENVGELVKEHTEKGYFTKRVFTFAIEARSTSMGDVLEHDGKFFAVRGIGFQEVSFK